MKKLNIFETGLIFMPLIIISFFIPNEIIKFFVAETISVVWLCVMFKKKGWLL